MEEGGDYYVVKKGDMVAVYKTLNDCQAQICSSVSGPAASAYKGYCWSKEKAEYLSSRGLVNASYTISAAELREDLLGALVPCTFQEVTATSSNQRAPNRSTLGSDIRYQPGIHNDIKYEPGTQPVDLNYSVAGSGQAQGYSVQEHAFSGQMVCVVHFDGASKGNPGKSGAGAVLMTEDGRVISRLREGLGVATNNVAEYRGLILGLKYAIRLGFKRIKVYGDSQLVCYQVKGTWQAKKENMMELCKEVRNLQENFISFEVHHVRRTAICLALLICPFSECKEWNSEADRQANIAITLAIECDALCFSLLLITGWASFGQSERIVFPPFTNRNISVLTFISELEFILESLKRLGPPLVWRNFVGIS
uniref:Uncharacterized protein n=1 Tax=Aegilops tauschii TaxID=37682 RepID=N1QW33_AEGTA